MPTTSIHRHHPDAALACERLGHRFGNITALDQVNFSLPRGKIVGLLGPNGAGKTTLLRCLTGAIRPVYGRIRIDGFDPHDQPDEAQAHFGYQPDGAQLEPNLRLAECLDLSARLRGFNKHQRAERVKICLQEVDLSAQARQLVGTLSRGQRARAALAEAMLHQPPVLILDEPASGLDPGQVVSLRRLLRKLAGTHSMLLATHHLAEAQAVCDEVVVLIAGRVRYAGTVNELASQAADSKLETAYLALAGFTHQSAAAELVTNKRASS